MKFSLFYHSLVSDWNHGNAHFLRGVVSELLARGHEVSVFEPADSWSRRNLLQQEGATALMAFHRAYPHLTSYIYQRETLDLQRIARESDVVIVHEWNEPWLVNRFAELRRRSEGFCLLFHDTHHRIISDRQWLRRFRLEHYDGVLAFGEVISEAYRNLGWNRRVWTWHEAADTRVFYPREVNDKAGDVVWVGNWGDDERSQELDAFLLRPSREERLRTTLYGVRYPQAVLRQLERAGIQYRGWLANYQVPEVFAGHRVTIHVPRRYYRDHLPGIPTIRPFEAMACGIPLISAPWDDCEQLFTPGEDYLVARSTEEMKNQLRELLNDPARASAMAQRAVSTIRQRHSCAHRVDQLLDLLQGELGPDAFTHQTRSGRQRHASL